MRTHEVDCQDPRWILVQEVVQSPLFEKSPRLRGFLLHVTELELTGQRSEINELHIGIHVFGRSGNYNPGEDSIVRSQARFLRQRLHEYFLTSGAQSDLIVDIPKGSYVPVFEKRDARAVQPVAEVVTSPTLPGHTVGGTAPDDHPLTGHTRRRWWIGLSAVGAVLTIFLVVLIFVQAGRRDPWIHFWGGLFNPQRTQLIVPADSTLILIEELTGKQVSFGSYLNRDYQQDPALQKFSPNLRAVDLENSHYTSMADLRFVAQLYALPHINHRRMQIRYARELSMSDLREDNLILIGGSRANPWVSLFTTQSNFSVDFDWGSHQNRVVNRLPRAGEQSYYAEDSNNADRAEYGLITYAASLDQQGSVLMVSGTSSAGTQGSADLLFEQERFDSFLSGIQRADGSIPHFELLLECHSMNGNVTQAKVVTYRLLP